jgi:hypothetical protein
VCGSVCVYVRLLILYVVHVRLVPGGRFIRSRRFFFGVLRTQHCVDLLLFVHAFLRVSFCICHAFLYAFVRVRVLLYVCFLE